MQGREATVRRQGIRSANVQLVAPDRQGRGPDFLAGRQVEHSERVVAERLQDENELFSVRRQRSQFVPLALARGEPQSFGPGIRVPHARDPGPNGHDRLSVRRIEQLLQPIAMIEPHRPQPRHGPVRQRIAERVLPRDRLLGHRRLGRRSRFSRRVVASGSKYDRPDHEPRGERQTGKARPDASRRTRHRPNDRRHRGSRHEHRGQVDRSDRRRDRGTRKHRRRQGDPSPPQSLTQLLPPAIETPADNLRGPAERPGRPALRLPFEVARDERQPVSRRQCVEFFVQQCARLAPAQIDGRDRLGPRRLALVSASPCRGLLHLQRRPPGHAQEPSGQRAPAPNGVRLAIEEHERRLARVVRIRRVGKNGPARRGHERPMPADQRLKRGRIAMPHEGREQVPVRGRRSHVEHRGANALG